MVAILPVWIISAWIFAVGVTANAGRSKNLKKIDQAGRAAVALTHTGDGAASRSDDRD
jgi:hypothetical protein